MISKRSMMIGGVGLAVTAVLPLKASAAGIIRVPITFMLKGAPVVAVTIEGKGPYHFMIDTGASVSGIHDQTAREIGLTGTSQKKMFGYGGSEDTVVYMAHEVVFADRFRQINLALTGHKNLPLTGVDGMIAAGFLTALPSELDFDAAEIRLYNQVEPDFSAYTMLDSYRTSLNPTASSKMVVKVKIDGLPVRLLVDTGATSDVILFSGYVEKQKLWDKYPDATSGQARGVSGEKVNVRRVVIPEMDLGGHVLKRVQVSLTSPQIEDTVSYVYDGILGIGALRRFNLCFAKGKGLGVIPNRNFGEMRT